ncbi:MAG: TRAP transporter small permease [Gammaproteobacteria bacterium]|nr:TRAP transporter small permease [Gammaproteobacteria bacterium]
MKKYIQFVANTSKLCGIVSALMILLSVLIVCQMVWIRYVLEESSIWQTEFVTYLLISATFIGSPYVLLTRGHVNVDLLPLYLKQHWRLRMALFASVVSLAFCLIITYTGYEFWYEAWEANWKSDSIWEVRLWIPYFSLPFGFTILSLQYIADILSLLNGDEMPFGLSAEDTMESTT